MDRKLITLRGRLARAVHYENGSVAGAKHELLLRLASLDPNVNFEGHTSKELLTIADDYIRRDR